MDVELSQCHGIWEKKIRASKEQKKMRSTRTDNYGR